MLRGLILAVLATCALAQWDPQYAAGHFGIVHLFEWHWGTIADECETFFAPKKIAGIQISPPNENRIVDTRPWWERYQPISYILGTRSGDRDAFINMVQRCNAVGVNIYPDIVINHMCGNGGSGTGTAGSFFNADKNSPSFPGVPFGPTDFNKDNCYTASGEIENYGDADQVRNCMLVGLLDLNQGKTYVRDQMEAYMNDLIDIGVAGFRVDACKHMWPGDLEAIFGSLHDLRSDVFGSGKRAYIFQEVIDQGGEPITAGEYTGIGSVTEFKYGLNLGSNVHSLQYLSNFGEQWGMLPGTNALVFINNHDNQRGHGGGGNIVTFDHPYDLKILSAFMLAWPYGVPRVMSSYYFSNSDEGPPSSQRSVNADGSCGNGWVCEHRWRPITNMFAFGEVAQNQPVQNWWTNDNNQIAFSRGSKAFLAINNAGYDMSENLQTGLPSGSYCNVILGDFYDNKCAAECITVGSDGIANIFIAGTSSDPMVALHVNAMTSECNVGGSGSGGSTGGGGGAPSTSCTDCNCQNKIDCGELASTEATCTASGCLWCPLQDGSTDPWCFYVDNTVTTAPGATTSSSSSSSATTTQGGSGSVCSSCACSTKYDCGYMGITEGECNQQGCLWCPSEVDGEPWCITAATDSGTPNCNVADSSKQDCGYMGIDAAGCESQSCCWQESNVSGVPWCYYKV